MGPCLAVLKSIHMSHCPREDVIQTLLTLLSGPGTPPLQQSVTSPLLALKHMGNYMPVGRKVKIGSDNRAFSVLYGLASLPFSEGKPARLIPGSRIIGTWEWPQNVVAVVLPHLDKKISQSVIARLLNRNRLTVRHYIRTRKLQKPAAEKL
jgi:hypothetical protein